MKPGDFRPEERAAVLFRADEIEPRIEYGVGCLGRPVVDEVFSMAKVGDAHKRLEGRKAFGKVVVKI